MKILIFGDIVGRTGREIVSKHILSLKKKYNIDLTIANGENAAHGKGITRNIYNEFLAMGVDVITLGNHAFSQKEAVEFISNAPRLLRPLNFHHSCPGRGTLIINIRGHEVRVTNLIGQVFMNNTSYTNPFDCLDNLINSTAKTIHIIDFHAEVTSEKMALAWAFDGKVSAIFGTHTHVQTADERLLELGTGYISDVGMCGASNGVIGAKREVIIPKMWTGIQSRYEVAEGNGQLNALVLSIDESTMKTSSLERIFIR